MPIAVFGEPSGQLESMTLARDDKTLVVGHSHQTQLWNLDGDKPVVERTLAGVTKPVYDRLGGRLATMLDGEIKLWDMTGREPVVQTTWVQPDKIAPWTMAFSPSGDMLVTAGDRGKLFAWDLKCIPPRLAGQYTSHYGSGISAIAFSPDGQTFASADWKDIQFWDVKDAHCVRVSRCILSRTRSLHWLLLPMARN